MPPVMLLPYLVCLIKTHRNIPVFIPQEGCPNACVFCSQKKITGVDRRAELDTFRATVEKALESKWQESEIAFFGGSFTAIDIPRMTSLLDAAYEYVKNGKVSGIRVSTRPDFINDHILTLLKSKGVTAIELGIQSVSEKVLQASGRGHTAMQSENACKQIKKYGFRLGGQMMVGLPLSDACTEVQTAKSICGWGADETRIYPTVVFEDTPLYRMTLSGEYTPLSVEDAVIRCADCMEIFLEHGVKVLRVGLHASESLVSAPFGATHPAMGELVESEIYRRRISALIGEKRGKKLVIKVPMSAPSKAAGQHRANIEFFKKAYGFTYISVYGYDDIPEYTAQIYIED